MMRTKLIAAALLAGGLALYNSGCGGGGGGGGGTATPTSEGDVSLSVTDAASDQIVQFEVDLTAIDLTRLNGAVVHTLPARTRVDFAELVNESQLLSSFGCLAGIYPQVSVTMDFSNASVLITGQTTPARVLDVDGNPVTGAITLPIQLESGRPLTVTPGLHQLISLDFDLDSSCAIDTSTNTVQLGAVLKAEAQPVAPKVTFVGGVLASVDSSASSFTVTVNRPGAIVTGPSVTITTSPATIFYIEGQMGTFADLAARPLGTPILAQGAIDPSRRVFAATAVEAFRAMDVVRGHVVARAVDGTLTVLGAGLDTETSSTSVTGSLTLNQQYTVTAGGTRVFRRGVGSALTHDAIAVGQRVYCRGTLTGTTLDATVAGGHVRLAETGFFGFANGPVSGGVLTMTLARIGRRPVTEFNFNVGGTISADPNSYTVNTSTLNLSSIVAGTPVVVRGWCNAWNAPSATPEALALTVVDRTNVASLLYCDWFIATASPFASSSSSEIVLDLGGTFRRFVDPGFVFPVRLASTDRPRIVPASSGTGLFVVIQNGAITLHGTFAAYQADIAGRLANGARAKAFSAVGKWNDGAMTVEARTSAIVLK